jgi:hypothetical protein
MGFKYVMFKVPLSKDTEVLIPIIFPDKLVHADVAENLKQTVATSCSCKIEEVTVQSAGEINIDVLECYGKSTTLKVSSDPEDEKVIQMYPYMHGIL